jgi:hypothetical protein
VAPWRERAFLDSRFLFSGCGLMVCGVLAVTLFTALSLYQRAH